MDKSIFRGNDSLVLAYVRFMKEESLRQKQLFTKLLDIYSRGESIFNVVKNFTETKWHPIE